MVLLPLKLALGLHALARFLQFVCCVSLVGRLIVARSESEQAAAVAELAAEAQDLGLY